jgi:hypothetical protein
LGSAYVNAYSTRPRLHVRTERNRRYNSYSFVNSVCREPIPTQDELKHAYHIAGSSFVGQLKEFFLVLDDDQAKKGSGSGGQSKSAKNDKAGKGGKRRASGDNSNETKKKIPSTQ